MTEPTTATLQDIGAEFGCPPGIRIADWLKARLREAQRMEAVAKAARFAMQEAHEDHPAGVVLEPELAQRLNAALDGWERRMASDSMSGPTTDTRVRWRHKKRGTVYVEIARGCLQTADAPALDDQSVVIYQSEAGGCIWVRPTYEFEDGRFEMVTQ